MNRSPDSGRHLIGRHVARVVLRPRAIEIRLSDRRDDQGDASRASVDVEEQSTDNANDLAARSDSDTTETQSSCSDVESSIASASQAEQPGVEPTHALYMHRF